ncbi:TPA: hypothetical protein I1656_002432 [Staphylococcus pseudintermedius]|nr:hypothetical protein [Staphylococcus pseudintermedius]HAR6073276.1 hypothetical protein [Staphylococcus pseudintermedius]
MNRKSNVSYLKCVAFFSFIRLNNSHISSKVTAVSGFVIFGILGYFWIKDASSLGKYLFVTLIALILASLVGWWIHSPVYYTMIAVVGLLLFLLYTLYDFNRMKRGQFSPRELGFNLFINLFHIIRYVLELARIMKR